MACMSSVQEARILQEITSHTGQFSLTKEQCGFTSTVLSPSVKQTFNKALPQKMKTQEYKQLVYWFNVHGQCVTFHSLPFWRRCRPFGICSAFPVQARKTKWRFVIYFKRICLRCFPIHQGRSAHLYSGHSRLHSCWGGCHLLLHHISQLSLLQLQTPRPQLLVSRKEKQEWSRESRR